MTDKLKLVYNWYGPYYPLRNNQEDLKSALTLARDKDNIKISPFSTVYLFKDNPAYEYALSPSLQKDDYFLYELTVDKGKWLDDYSFDLLLQCDIPNNVIDGVKNKNGYVLLDACRDSFNLHRFFDNVHILFQNKNIPLCKVILLLGHANAKTEYTKWCEGRDILHIDRASIVEYQWAEISASKEIQNHTPNDNINFYKRNKTFLCYNRKTKPHRSDLLTLFYKFNLLQDSYFSMPEHCIEKSILWKILYRAEADDLEINDSKRRKILLAMVDTHQTDKLQALFPLVIDGITKVEDMERVVNSPYSVYDSSLISVITESTFVDSAIYHSEKTWKAIANNHPFIIVGPAGSIKSLKDMGYKTFGSFFDESYDDEKDDFKRLMNIVSLCRDISSWSSGKKKNFFYESMAITRHNYNLLKSIYPTNKRNDIVILNK